ncbi:hypothetical protein GCM10010129_59550 [Streptomyces fumigatiscleroticus]|nr:hypothetical protein GCM10010129_59550 [Streptomyces fumigatiscleroticus]
MREGNTRLGSHMRTRRVDGHTVIELHGEIDIAACARIMWDMDASTAPGVDEVVIDLNSVDFLDCYGLRLLCRAERRLAERSGRLLVVCGRPQILKILRAGGLIQRFSPVPTLAEALRPDAAGSAAERTGTADGARTILTTGRTTEGDRRDDEAARAHRAAARASTGETPQRHGPSHPRTVPDPG